MARRDDFTGGELDRSTWLPHYLPVWSSRAATAATYEVDHDGLHLRLPVDAPLWCPDAHPEPLRVSGIQSGNRSGPVGSTDGQQAFDPTHPVQEEQERFEGWLPTSGTLEVRCRMDLSPRSMAALWLSGFEDHPDDAGELCVVEVFGRSLDADGVDVGVGVKQLGDPRLRQDVVDPHLALDVSELHTYAVTWGDGVSTFSVDGDVVHRSPQAPGYPVQIMIAVFDFPAWSSGDDGAHVPELVVEHVAHRP